MEQGIFYPKVSVTFLHQKASLLKLIGLGGSYYAKHLSMDASGSADVLAGAFMMLPRSLYNKVGGFDEDYFMYGEDIDFSYKITQAGYRNHYLGTAEILHYKGESTHKTALITTDFTAPCASSIKNTLKPILYSIFQ